MESEAQLKGGRGADQGITMGLVNGKQESNEKREPKKKKQEEVIKQI